MNSGKKLVIPNFLCIGAQKTGTTALYHILKNHPEITVSKPRKETKFFYRDSEYKQGLEFYSKFFSYGTPAKAIGEFDPDYLYFDYVPERIFHTLGANIKFIVIFRHPVDRAYSQYLMSVHRSHENKEFEEAIRAEKSRLKDASLIHRNHFSYLSRGCYDEQLARYFKYFPKENFLFLKYEEEIQQNISTALSKIFSFLNISETDLDTNIKMNEASKPKSKTLMRLVQQQNPLRSILSTVIRTPETRQKLRKSLMRWNRKKIEKVPLDAALRNDLYEKYFVKNIEALERMTGMNFSSWKEKAN
ncbi:MAG TPA: hypothetical protein DCQ93_00430 [Bacteroidetes bacterium]|nr:hypothetical protein [Bacteroidota bacterium]